MSHADDSNRVMNRRSFLSAASATSAAVLMAPNLVRGDAANAKIRIGLIGSGRRGAMLADLFEKHGGFKLTALADYFPDRVDEVGQKFAVPANKRFTGLACHKKLLAEAEIDAVVIESPPYFHPEQAADAVAASKHVFVAKPVAVDVPGCQSIAESGRLATARKLVMLVDFQTRATGFYIEALRRVHAGDIGPLVFGEAFYHAEELRPKGPIEDTSPEGRLRNWIYDKTLSGDVIVEQHIHALDVMSWIMNAPPLCATGMGGRKVRTFAGDAWDYFTALFEYPDDVGITFSSRQFKGHGSTPNGIVNRMFGSTGVLETKYGGEVLIRGENFYRGGSTQTIYRDGAMTNIAAFHDAIRSGDVSNPTVEPSVRSNLVSVLGRIAAYENRRVTWDELMASKQTLKADLGGLRS